MLNAKENMIEVMKGPDGHPDRFVNQYEAIQLLFHPPATTYTMLKKGETNVKNGWGVTMSFPENTPGQFPVHTPDKIVVKDIEHWRDYVKAPSLKFPEEMWDQFKAMWDQVDGTKAFKCAFVAPGLFEQTHHLCEISNALVYYALNEDEMHDMLKYLTDWEIEAAEGICSHLHPEMLFHHDDWGSAKTTFMSVPMFEDYFVEPYKAIYGYYHDHGVKYVVHHSDSYAATLVPDMIEMGINVWQGCMESNDLSTLIAKYGDKITFMGGIDNMAVDFEGWTDENCQKVVDKACSTYGMHSYIPCIVQGGPGSVYSGVYTSLVKAIDKYNMENCHVSDPAAERLPLQILFG